MNVAAWLTDTITVASVSSRNTRGDPVFGAQNAYPARVEPITRLTRSAQGQEAIADTRVFTTQAINLTDRIWVPGANTSDPNAARVPLSVRSSSTKAKSYTLYEVLL